MVPLQQRQLYTEDWIGLRALDEAGRLFLHTTDCPHASYPTAACKNWYDLYTAPLLNNAVDQATALAHNSMNAVRDSSRRLREQARMASDQTVGYIKDEPVKSMLMAAAAGAVLMGLINLLGRSRNRG